MPLSFRTVIQSKDVIRFGGRVNDKASRDFVPVLYEVIGKGYTEIVLDFRRCERAYASAVLPIICLLDHRRERGNEFSVVLPADATLRNLFLNANWAHFMDPSHPKVDLDHPHHVPARRYATHGEQKDIVRAVLDVMLRTMELRRDVISALEWSLNEITDNVLNHAQAPQGGLVQVSTFQNEHKIRFVVADAGRGIPAAMRVTFPDIETDATALDEAIKAGVTSIPDSGQGNGLAGSLRVASFAKGAFQVAAGKAQLGVFEDPKTGNYCTQKVQAPYGHRFPGTVVAMMLSTDTAFDIEEALALDGTPRPVMDVVDLRYAREDDSLVVRVCDESYGHGTRHAGVELRRKCRNLLNAEPSKRLVLDWTGVPVISSSFADEAIGKLFVELGPTTFTARVGNSGTEPLVRSLLDRAVMQRVAQTVRAAAPAELADE